MAIVRGNLRPGQRVPSSRSLAVELGISRIPVLNAYAQLLAEGYFESRKGAGTFVSDALPESLTVCKERTPQFAQAGSGPRPVARRGLSYQRNARRGPAAGAHLACINPRLTTFHFRSGRASSCATAAARA